MSDEDLEDALDEGYEMGFEAANDFIAEFVLSMRRSGVSDSDVLNQLEKYLEGEIDG